MEFLKFKKSYITLWFFYVFGLADFVVLISNYSQILNIYQQIEF